MIIWGDVILVTCRSKYLFRFELQTCLLTASTHGFNLGFVRDARPAVVAARGLRGER
jgi:hypothetical protein